MSSRSFEADLEASRRGRLVVSTTAVLFAAAGAGIALTMPWSWPIRVLCTFLWLADAGIGLWRIRRGWAVCERIRLSSSGAILVTGPDGSRQSVSLATGTLVLRQFAWLRYTTQAGWTGAEFLICRSPEDPDWHRFQVIWRLARGAFGQRGVA